MFAQPVPTGTGSRSPEVAGRVALRCDASASGGVGHVMRCLALAEGLHSEGLDVLLLGDLGGITLATSQVRNHGLEIHPVPAGTAGLLQTLDLLTASALVIDSYTVPAEHYAAARASGRLVIGVVDAAAPDLDADLLVNQNLDAQHSMSQPHRARVLAGPTYALVREAVTDLRPQRLPDVPNSAHRVLVVAGGTDVANVTADLAARILGTGRPVHLDVLCPNAAARDQVANAGRAAGQTVVAHAPVDDLASLAVRSDLVVTAAGTTVLEIACLGRAMAVFTVADNQEGGYAALLAAGAAHGLGPASRLGDPAERTSEKLATLLDDSHQRSELAERAYALVDGEGRGRVAGAIAAMLAR
jgi:spore coat polysaccharide biosynthesis predicted glycosyltransferase SpsG